MAVPKYLGLKSALRQKIVRGEFAGGMLPSESALRTEYGVSTQTIIRALHDLRTEGLVRRHQGKGTFVNTDHSSDGRIGILTYIAQTGAVKSVYRQNLLRGLLGRLRELGEEPHIYSFSGEGLVPDFLEHGQKVLEHAAGGRLQCLVVTESYEPDEVESAVSKWGVPVIGTHRQKALSRYNVTLDTESLASDGIQYLLDQGSRKLGLIIGRPVHVPVHPDVMTYWRLMEQSRLSVRPGWVRGDLPPSAMSGYQAFREMWAMDDRPDAVLILDDIMAQGAIRAMVELGVSTERDLTVMVQINRKSGLVFPLPFVALEFDVLAIGAACAEMAVQLVRGDAVEQPQLRVKLTPRIYPSTGLPGAEAEEMIQPDAMGASRYKEEKTLS
jgi:DNA-binding LacI/PurR family transcriptional regulator